MQKVGIIMEEKKCHITSIGGQAVIEGVMMRGPKDIAVAVRKPDGEIEIDKKPLSSILQKCKWLKLPIIRGVVSFIESLIIGTKALMYSASFFDLEEEETKKKKESMTEEERAALEKKESKALTFTIYTSVVFALVFGIGIFMLLPTFLVGLVKPYIPYDFLATLFEGIVRIIIFLVYIILVSQMKDIRRVFEYHGAEHKTIFCYESGDELTPENARKYSRLHPRCGTSFLLIVMVVSIILFSFISWDNAVMRIILRLALLPVVAGLSYEVIKFAGRSKSRCMKIVSAPGMLLQKLTTREPDDSQLEVAIASLKSVLTGNREDDKW
ncbi:MAG: DUF1385 domain-containing protein [Clostridia bacterium]|nr:DUF1385 domain-containing protein [Clostridia bacterium]MBQ3553787.1 DUF1385 domain-containing protein [Clostridia bacterium]